MFWCHLIHLGKNSEDGCTNTMQFNGGYDSYLKDSTKLKVARYHFLTVAQSEMREVD